MAITASKIATNNTLEQFRQEFNNLQADVDGLETGTITFSTISATTQNVTNINVLEDGDIVFEGATDNAFETTLTVADPTADRTITLPNTSGTVVVSGDGSFTVSDGGTVGSTSATDAITIASTGIITFKDDIIIKDGGTIGVTSTIDAMTVSSAGIVTFKDDIVIKDGGTIGTGTTPAAITIASGGDVTLSGDLTISGDDLTMGTNTSGHLLIADGTNFNPVAVTSLSEISTVASDDVFLAIDTSGGGLKKIARSTVVSGLASSSAISNVVEDTSPQLGGNLDILARTITTSTTNGNIAITPDGTGVVLIDGQVGIEAGIIDLKNSGSTVSKILFYCESSNAHAQTLIGAPHSESASNTLTLPSTGGNSRLVSAASTATLTNKTLTSPVLNTATVGTSIVPASADGATLGTASVEFSDLFLADAGTIQFGNDQEVRLTHVADVGLTLTHTGSGDNLPIVLQLKSEEDAIIANEVIGSIEFAAGDTDGTDGATVAAGIHAIAEGTFASDANATKLVFTTGVSETAASSATAKMTLSSAGLLTIADDFLIKDGGTIGVASTVDAITISSGGIVTFKDDILIKDGGTIGTPTTADAITIASAGDVTLGYDLALTKDGGRIDFGVNADVSLTHVHDTGILLNSTMAIQFNDASQFINAPSATVLDINATDEIELNATLMDINGNVEISGTTTQTGVSTSAAKDIFSVGMSIKNGSTSAGFVEFFENSGNGTNKATLIGPASTADVTLTLPSTTDTLAAQGDVTALAIALG